MTAITANRNVARANTRVKQAVSHAFREVSNFPTSRAAPGYLRKVAKSLRKLATTVPLTKAAVNNDDWSDKAMRGIERLSAVADGGFENNPVAATDDPKLVKLAQTQARNTLRPVNFLKPIKDQLNASTPNWTGAADGLDHMANSLELGIELAAGNVRAAKRRASALANSGYVPASVVRTILH